MTSMRAGFWDVGWRCDLMAAEGARDEKGNDRQAEEGERRGTRAWEISRVASAADALTSGLQDHDAFIKHSACSEMEGLGAAAARAGGVKRVRCEV